MNATIVQLIIAGVIALGQLVAGVVLVVASDDPSSRGIGIGLIVGAGGTTVAASMRTRGPDAVPAVAAVPPPLPPPPDQPRHHRR